MSSRAMLVLGMLAAAQLEAQASDTVAALRSGPAATRCQDGQPATTWGIPVEPTIQAQVAVHEAVHSGQLAGSCDSTLAVILAHPLLLADAEAEAGCAQFLATPMASIDVGLEYGKLRGWLYARVPSLPHDLLDAMLARYCGVWRRT